MLAIDRVGRRKDNEQDVGDGAVDGDYDLLAISC
jgi:hypothetical protein